VADGEPNQPEQQPPQRRFAASRVRPRVQVSRTPLPPPERAEPVESVESDRFGERSYDGGSTGSPLFGQPREFAGGRVRVYGCSPGCLIASLAISLLLSWLLTALIN
jgi:hypothetical protein